MELQQFVEALTAAEPGYVLQKEQQEILDGLMTDMGLTCIRSFYVDHCSQSFGLALQVSPPVNVLSIDQAMHFSA